MCQVVGNCWNSFWDQRYGECHCLYSPSHIDSTEGIKLWMPTEAQGTPEEPPPKHKAPTSDLAVPSMCPTLCTVGHLYYTPPTPSPTKCPQPGTHWDSPTLYSPGFQLAKATRHTQSTQGMATPSRLGEEVFHVTHSNKHRE